MRRWIIWGGVAVLVVLVAVEPVLQAFIAEMAGGLLGSLIDPIYWGIGAVLGLRQLPWQPWLGIAVGALVGAASFFYFGYTFALWSLPMFTAKMLTVVVPVLVFQAIYRATQKKRAPEGSAT